MPSVVMGPSKEGYVWVINDAEDKMYVPERTIMGIGQDWEKEKEEHEIEEYSEPVSAVRGVAVAVTLLFIKYRVFSLSMIWV